MTKSTRSLVLTGALAYAGVFALARFSFSVLLPAMQEDLGTTVSVMGYLASCNLGGYVTGSGLALLLTSRYRNDRVALAGLATCCVALFVMALTPSAALAFPVMAVLGVGSALGFIATTAVLNRALSERRGRSLGLATAGIGIGTVTCSVLISGLLRIGPDGWRVSWFVLGVVMTLTLPVIARTLSRAEHENRTAHPAGDEPAAAILAAMAPSRRILIVPVYMLWGIGYVVYATFLTAFLHDERGLAVESAALIYSLTGVSTIVGGPIAGPLSDRYGRRLMIAVSCVVCAASVLLLLASYSLPAYAVSALLFGMPISAMGTLVAAYVGDLWNGVEQGPVFGSVTMLFGLTQTAGPTLVGFTVIATGTLTTGLVASIVAVLIAAASAALLPPTHQLSVPAIHVSREKRATCPG